MTGYRILCKSNSLRKKKATLKSMSEENDTVKALMSHVRLCWVTDFFPLLSPIYAV